MFSFPLGTQTLTQLSHPLWSLIIIICCTEIGIVLCVSYQYGVVVIAGRLFGADSTEHFLFIYQYYSRSDRSQHYYSILIRLISLGMVFLSAVARALLPDVLIQLNKQKQCRSWGFNILDIDLCQAHQGSSAFAVMCKIQAEKNTSTLL